MAAEVFYHYYCLNPCPAFSDREASAVEAVELGPETATKPWEGGDLEGLEAPL